MMHTRVQSQIEQVEEAVRAIVCGTPVVVWGGTPSAPGAAFVMSGDSVTAARLAMATEAVTLDRLVLREETVDRPPEHALALAVDDPQVPDAPRPADLEVLPDQGRDLLGREIVQVELAVDRNFDALPWVHARSPGPGRRGQARGPGLAQGLRSAQAALVGP